MSSTSRRLALAACAAAAIAALAGCASAPGGAAATFSNGRIAQSELTSAVQEIQSAKGQPANAGDPILTPTVLGRMITAEVVDQLAAREGIVVTQGQIDEQYAGYVGQLGSEAAVRDTFIQRDVAPSQIESIIRLNLQAQALGIKLDPSGSAEQQGAAVFQAVADLSQELQTTVSPRYGTWNGPQLSVGPLPDDLSAPPTAG